MKNVQIIDGAVNCAYSVYAVSEETFHVIFPATDQDVEFIEDLVDRLGEQKAGDLLAPVWQHRVEKADLHGIHGTLFFELSLKRKFYPSKKESDLDDPTIQRGLR